MHLRHGWAGSEKGKKGGGGAVRLRGALMKNERMRRLGKLLRQWWPPCDYWEERRDEEGE